MRAHLTHSRFRTTSCIHTLCTHTHTHTHKRTHKRTHTTPHRTVFKIMALDADVRALARPYYLLRVFGVPLTPSVHHMQARAQPSNPSTHTAFQIHTLLLLRSNTHTNTTSTHRTVFKIMALDADVRALARPYYLLRVFGVPLKFVNSVVMGVLGGYQRMPALMALQLIVAAVQVCVCVCVCLCVCEYALVRSPCPYFTLLITSITSSLSILLPPSPSGSIDVISKVY